MAPRWWFGGPHPATAQASQKHRRARGGHCSRAEMATPPLTRRGQDSTPARRTLPAPPNAFLCGTACCRDTSSETGSAYGPARLRPNNLNHPRASLPPAAADCLCLVYRHHQPTGFNPGASPHPVRGRGLTRDPLATTMLGLRSGAGPPRPPASSSAAVLPGKDVTPLVGKDHVTRLAVGRPARLDRPAQGPPRPEALPSPEAGRQSHPIRAPPLRSAPLLGALASV